MKSNKHFMAYLTLVFTFFCWGSIYVAGRMITEVPAPLVAAFRCLIAVGPLMLAARHKGLVKVAREDWKYFISVGAFGYFLTILLIQEGISRSGASMASLINSLTPVGVTIFAAIILKEKITWVKVLCLGLALSGTWIIISGAGGEGEIVGIILCLFSVISWSIASVNMRRLTATYPAIMVTAYGMAVSLVFHIPVGLFVTVSRGGTGLSLKAIVVLLYLGLIGSCLAQYSWTASLAKIPASICSLFYPLQPTFSAILGALLLGERVSSSFLLGMLLIGIDVALSTWENQRLSKLEEIK